MLENLASYVTGLPSGRQMMHRVGEDVYKVSDLVGEKTKVVKQLRRNVDRLADSELSQPSITPALTKEITRIKQEAADLAVKGGNDLAEGMQAVSD
jgi:hypothetical protein